jgi:chromodomain-helicase-DNA-binding protein 4
MCKVVEENPTDLVQASLARESAEVNTVKKFPPLETICEDVNRILTPTVEQPISETPILNSDNKSEAISHGDETKDMAIDADPVKESGSSLVIEKETPSLAEKKESNTEMNESSNAELDENTPNSDAGVIVLDA